MGQDSSFTGEERALWHWRRRLGLESESDLTREELEELEKDMKDWEALEDVGGLDDGQGAPCIHCGAPIGSDRSIGEEGGLCSAVTS